MKNPNDQMDDENKKSSAERPKKVPITVLFRHADKVTLASLFLGLLGSIVAGAVLPGINFVFGDIIDAIASPILSKELVNRAVYSMLALGGIGFVSFFTSSFFCGFAASRIANGFRIEYLKAVLRQDAQHFDHAEPGAVALTLSDAAFDIQNGLSDKFAQMLQGVFQFVFGFAFAFYFGPLLTSLLLGFVPVLGIITYLLATYGSEDDMFGRKAYEDAAGIASETLSNMRTVMSLNAETIQSKRYDNNLEKSEKAAIKQGTGLACLTGSIFLTIFIMYGLGFWLGGSMIADSTDDAIVNHPPSADLINPNMTWYELISEACGEYLQNPTALEVCACGLPWETLIPLYNLAMELPNCGCGYSDPELPLGQTTCFSGGDTLMVFFSILVGGFALGQIAPGIKALSGAVVSASQMMAVINRYPDIDVTKTAANSSQKALSREDVKGEICFDNVGFHYTPKERVGEESSETAPVFAKINLTLKPGESVALVGESGCGKSTIAKLVQRFYDPTSGKILLDGVDIKELAVKDLRANIGVVSQEPLLFNKSVLENIRYGKPDATDAEVIAAAKNANAHGFISSFPEGYNTQVGPKGGKLSGGQKQRVAIARALLRDPPILILDEATSALDNKSERIVQKTLDQLVEKKGAKSNRTTIIIAHRMSTIRNADHICVLGSPDGTSTAANGSIVLEEGNHEELMNINGGFYKALIMAGSKEGGTVTSKSTYISDNDSEKEYCPDDMMSDSDEKSQASDFTELADSSIHSSATKDDKKKKDKEQTSSWKKMFAPKDPAEVEKAKKEKDLYKSQKNRIWEYTKPDMKWIIFGSLASAIKGMVFPLLAVVFASMINSWYDSDTDGIRSDSLSWSFFFYGLAVIVFLTEGIQKGIFEMIGERLSRRIRADLFRAMLRQDITWFEDDKNSLGVLTSNLSTDVKYVRLVSGQSVAATIETFSALTAGIVIAWLASWEIFLIMLAMVPLLGAAEAMQWLALSGSESKVKKSIESCSSKLNETVNGIREVQAFDLQGMVAQDIELLISQTVIPKSKNAAISKGIMMGMIQLIQFSVYAFAFWFGSKMIEEGRIDFDDFNMALWAMAFAASGLGQAALFAGDAAKASAAVKNISSILDQKVNIESKPWDNDGFAKKKTGAAVVREISEEALTEGEWELEDVNFVYPTRPNAKVFNKMNVEIPNGKTVALVGSSGSGKSTVVQLLERFYDPATPKAQDYSEGELSKTDINPDDLEIGNVEISLSEESDSGIVKLNGKDIRELDIRWVRQKMGLVGQEPVLFNDTVYNNIALGKENCTKKEVEDAAKSANAYNFIMELPEKFETNVGVGGSKVSGGQKQRIAIARALVSNPKILLLDEATSALDNESEKIVQASLDKLVKEGGGDRTTIIIAHRLSTIQDADMICVLENDGDGSKVVEKGTHAELMALGKKYKALVEAYAK